MSYIYINPISQFRDLSRFPSFFTATTLPRSVFGFKVPITSVGILNICSLTEKNCSISCRLKISSSYAFFAAKVDGGDVNPGIWKEILYRL